jgi:glycosyltransferase involved in cell wall biosynthesis
VGCFEKFMKEKRKVLIVAKDIQSRGGVVNYFRLFFDKYSDDIIEIEWITIGSRAEDYYVRTKRKIAYIKEFLLDIRRLIKLLKKDRKIQVVQINPSFIPIPLVRDGLILLVAKAMHRKVVVFFRGWQHRIVGIVEKNLLLRKLFALVYGRADRTIILAKDFQKPLIRCGIPAKSIFVSRTMFDGTLVQPRSKTQNKCVVFLFLGRFSESKGIFDIMRATAILQKLNLDFRITFTGYGLQKNALDYLKCKAEESGIQDICIFRDYVDGKEKFKEYAKADIYLLPSWAEGCPNSVLEAMAAGLFVISTDVGALKEVINDGINGRFVKVHEPQDLAEKMEWSIKNIAKVRQLGEKNKAYAFENFESTKIIGQIKTIYNDLLTV